MASMKILASGMSGLVGGALLPALARDGNEVVRLVRQSSGSSGEIQLDPAQPITPEKVSGFDAVIHLAGETIFGRWTESKKAKIRDSRILGTRYLAEALAASSRKPAVMICASAIGYYGDRGAETLTESSAPGNNFLAGVCQAWEAAAQIASKAGIRVVSVRFGVILSPNGGALKEMLTPFKLGVGGRLGSGRQYMSWISITDVVNAIQHVMTTESLRGPVNFVSPQPVTNSDFTRTLAGVLHRPAILPMPAFAVKAVFGEMGDELLLASARVIPSKLEGTNYSFRHGELGAALKSMLSR